MGCFKFLAPMIVLKQERGAVREHFSITKRSLDSGLSVFVAKWGKSIHIVD